MAEDALNSGVSSHSLALKSGRERASYWLLGTALFISLLLHLGLLLFSTGWRITGADDYAKAPDGAVIIASLVPKAATPSLAPPAPLPVPTAKRTPRRAPAASVSLPVASADTSASMDDAGLQPLPTLEPLPELMPLAPVAAPQLAERGKSELPVAKNNEAAAVAVAEGESNATPRLDATPGTIDIAYKVTSSVIDGTARYKFSRDKNNKYEIESTIEASGFFATIFEGRMQQTSRGSMLEQGLVPEFFSIQRGSGPPETATFDYAGNNIIFSRRKGVEKANLPFLLQDIQSFLFQMGFDAPGLVVGVNDVANPSAQQLNVIATNARKVYRYQFKLVAQETLDLPFGKIQTLHLKSDAADPTDVYEVWLATEYNHLPVKVKFFAGKFALVQTAQSIAVTPFKR